MKARITGILVVLALVVAGCGSRVTDRTAAAGGGLGAGPTPAGATGGGTGDTFGTVPNPCGPTPEGMTLGDGDLGVTADEITITTISDPGGPVSGLNQSLFDTMEAFVKWCNDSGGINGRRLELIQRDAGILRYKEMVLEACEDSFALVGGLGVLDDLGAQDALDCGLVNVPAAGVTAAQVLAPNTFAAQPNPPNRFVVGPARWVKEAFPGAEEAAASVFTAISTTITQQKRLQEAYTLEGFDFVAEVSANQNETNWGPNVSRMRSAGVKYLTMTSSYEQIIPLQKEMKAQGWRPEVTELESNFYDQRYPAQAAEAGADTTNVYVRLNSWPFEEADGNPAMRRYLDLLEAAVPGAAPAALGTLGWSAALLFATAAKNAGAELTRAALEAEIRKISDWTGGGLHGRSNPGERIPGGCFVMMKVEADRFVRAYPLPDEHRDVYENDNVRGMACPEGATVDLEGDYGQGATRRGG